MKKLIAALASVAVGVAVAADSVVTNAVDVYDLTAKIKTPVIKSSGDAVYKTYATRTLKGHIYATWISEGDDEPYCVYDVELADGKTAIPFEVLPGAEFSVMGKKMNGSAATFELENAEADEDNAGYCWLAFSGNGSTATQKINTPVCLPCGGEATTKTKCLKVSSLSGNVVGKYSCGCGDVSPAYATAECGADDLTPTAINGCHGTWTAKYNKKLSYRE